MSVCDNCRHLNDLLDAAHAEARLAKAESVMREKALRKVEWIQGRCWMCYSTITLGHINDCELAAALTSPSARAYAERAARMEAFMEELRKAPCKRESQNGCAYMFKEEEFWCWPCRACEATKETK